MKLHTYNLTISSLLTIRLNLGSRRLSDPTGDGGVDMEDDEGSPVAAANG